MRNSVCMQNGIKNRKEKSMKFKRIIVALLLLCIAVSMAGCTWKWGFTIDGVTYFYHNCLCVIGINDFETEDSIENIYISDYINDVPVEKFGTNLYYSNPGFIHYSHTERIYFPWTISITNDADYTVEIGKEDVLKYLISASTQTIICEVSIYDSERYVMPNETYNRVLKGEIIGDYYAYQFPIKSENLSMYLPANISYFFNYDESPNENYFFVDLLEETGKLTKPPYDPKREGYTFGGWY